MSNVDEKIAKLKMQQRIEKEREANEKLKQDEPAIEEEKITLESVINQIKKGELSINDTDFIFRKKVFLNGRLEVPMPLSYFEERVNTDANVTLVNDLYGISFTIAYVDKGAKKQSFAQFKKGFEKNFKDMEFSLEWIEEGEIGEGSHKICYGTYKTPTGRGPIHNLIFYREYKGTLLIGNYNCFDRDIKTWELIIKASVMLMRVK